MPPVVTNPFAPFGPLEGAMNLCASARYTMGNVVSSKGSPLLGDAATPHAGGQSPSKEFYFRVVREIAHLAAARDGFVSGAAATEQYRQLLGRVPDLQRLARPDLPRIRRGEPPADHEATQWRTGFMRFSEHALQHPEIEAALDYMTRQIALGEDYYKLDGVPPYDRLALQTAYLYAHMNAEAGSSPASLMKLVERMEVDTLFLKGTGV